MHPGNVSADVERIRNAYRNYAGAHSLRWSGDNPGNRRISKERFEDLRALLTRAGLLPLTGLQILDIGCGGGNVLASMQDFGAQPSKSFGVDLRPESIAQARITHPDLTFSVSSGPTLDFPAEQFDVVMLFTVFSSILDRELRMSLASEASRVLRKGGTVIWYDLRYPSPFNKDIRPCTTRDMAELFPGFRRLVKSTTLLPPLARRLGSLTDLLYPVANAFPPLRSHYLALLRKPS